MVELVDRKGPQMFLCSQFRRFHIRDRLHGRSFRILHVLRYTLVATNQRRMSRFLNDKPQNPNVATHHAIGL
jgi:hypothetical protein